LLTIHDRGSPNK